MQRPLENFFRALRAADIRVSPAESIDAHRTVDLVGYHDRRLFKDALCVALAKTPEEVASFEDCFEMFFTREELADDNDAADGEGDEQHHAGLARAGLLPAALQEDWAAVDEDGGAKERRDPFVAGEGGRGEVEPALDGGAEDEDGD